MNLELYKEDIDKQEKGSPFYVSDDLCMYVRRLGTQQTRIEIEKLSKFLFGFTSKPDNDLLMGHWLAEYGVTGWDVLNDDSDPEDEYSKRAALAIFTNPEYMLSLNQALLVHATNYANYLFDDMSEDVEEVKKK